MLTGHPEAGRITFGAYRTVDGDVVFHIRSRACSSSLFNYLGFLVGGDPMQTATWTDFVIVGDEKPGWICEEQYIYAAFDFKATEPQHDWKEAHNSDQVVKVYPDRSACLTFP